MHLFDNVYAKFKLHIKANLGVNQARKATGLYLKMAELHFYKRKRTMKIILLAVLLFCTSAINAAVIDFEDLSIVFGGRLDPEDNTVITSGGFDFINGPTSSIPDLHVANNNSVTIGSTTELLAHNDLVMTQNGGGSFLLDSFSFGSSLQEVATFSVEGSLFGGGTVSQIFNMDGNTSTIEFYLLNSSFGNIVSARWLMVGGSSGAFNIDNISVNASVNAVPVPAALFMFAPALLGFLGLRSKAKVL